MLGVFNPVAGLLERFANHGLLGRLVSLIMPAGASIIQPSSRLFSKVGTLNCSTSTT